MSPHPVKSGRIAIVGASSLRGKELKELLGESIVLPGGELRLFDDATAVGLLTEAAGEPVVVQPPDEDSFRGAEIVFFAGTDEFTERHWADARRAGAVVIDLSGALLAVESALPWIPFLDRTLAPPGVTRGGLYSSPSTPAIIGCTLAAALAPFRVARLALVFFHPVSERGQAGIEELESQTVNLLSFQPISQQVFDAQVAFNLLGSYGAASSERLADLREAIGCEVTRYLDGRAVVPAIQLVQAPVFFSYAFTAYFELESARPTEELENALVAAGVHLRSAEEPAPSNVSVAGENQISIGAIQPDGNTRSGYWLWGAADNVRLAASNAVSIAERLRAS